MTAATLELGSDELHRALREWFGFESFLPGQEAVVDRALRGGDLLVVRPTGSGKSLCYQLPALLLPPLTVVISPLIALMKDQVDALNRRHAGAATFINSSISVDEQRRRLRDAVEGRAKLLYVAPERFRFPAFLRRLAETRVQRFVVDEAHCISEWGHDFRPDYRFLKEVLGPLGDPPLLALTATATQETQGDIATQLGRPGLDAVVSGFNRSNLSFEVRHATGEAMKLDYLERLLGEVPGSGIVYTATRKDTETVAKFVDERTHRPVVAYHAGFEADHRSAGQDAFMAAPDAIAVATCAFGMGIDKPEVRFVIHYSVPGSLEAYYQQAGRGGRDGLPARCILLYCQSDRALQEWFTEHEGCSGEAMAELLQALAGGLTSLPRLAARLDCHELQVRSGVRTLDRLGFLEDRSSGEGPLQVDVVVPDMTTAQIAEQNERNRFRRRLRESQLRAMCHYAETPRSRRLVLLKYFGDPTQPTAEELERDDPAPPPPDPGQVTPEETEVARRILETVQAARYAVGRQKLVQVVKGSASSKLDQYLKRLPTFGTLKAFATDHLAAAVDDLVRQGYLQPTGGEFPVLALGEPGKAALADPRALVAVESLRATAPVLAGERPGKRLDVEQVAFNELTPAEAELFERLRRWRGEKGREYGIAPFMVSSDRTLRALCRARPSSASELLTIPGIGPQKADGYGREVLALIETWRGQHPDADLTPPEPPAAAPPTPPVPPEPPIRAEVKLTDSALETLALLDEGLDVPAVAERRQVQAATVTNDVNALIAAGRLTPERLLGEELTERIRQVLAARPGISLAEAKTALGPEAGYSAIRWVRQWLEAQRPRSEPEPVAAAAAVEPLPGPWEAGWRVAVGGAEVLLAAVAVVLDPGELALAAVVGDDPADERLAREISRRVGVPVSYGLFAADGGLLARARLAEPLLLAGPEGALRVAAAAAGEAGVRRILAVCHRAAP